MNKLQTYLKLVSQNWAQHSFQASIDWVFDQKKLVVTNLKVGKNFFSYLCLRFFFHQNHSLVTTYCRSLIVGKFLRRCSENFINFPIKHSQDVLGNLQLCFKKYFNVDVFHFSCFAIHLSWFMLC